MEKVTGLTGYTKPFIYFSKKINKKVYTSRHTRHLS